jgi:hypothetical protein
MENELICCAFAEWFGRNRLDSKNGGYYMHDKSGMEVNKLYNIQEIYNFFKLTINT